MLSLIPQLCYLHLTDERSHMEIMLADLPISKLQTLSIMSTNSPLSRIHETSSIKHLTISRCFLDELYQLFLHTPMLKYLNSQCLDDTQLNDTNISINNSYAVHLTTLKCL